MPACFELLCDSLAEPSRRERDGVSYFCRNKFFLPVDPLQKKKKPKKRKKKKKKKEEVLEEKMKKEKKS